MNVCFENVKVTSIDARAIEWAIATWCLPLALRRADVNLDRGTIDFRRTVSTARVKGETSTEKHRWFDPKTKKGIREIPIPGELVTALRE